MFIEMFDVADGDRQEAKCDNRADPAFSVARASATSSLGGGEGETGHHDGT